MDPLDEEPPPQKPRPGDVANHPHPEENPSAAARQQNPPLIEASRVRFPTSARPSQQSGPRAPLRRISELRHQVPWEQSYPKRGEKSCWCHDART